MAVALATLAGCASPSSPAQPTATVLSVHGKVTYATSGASGRLHYNRQLRAGTIIETGKNSRADIEVNGFASHIILEANSLLELTTMNHRGDERDGYRDTELRLERGSLICDVRRLWNESRYEVHAPNGFASVTERGGTFKITVQSDSKTLRPRVKYRAVRGQLFVSALLDSGTVTNVLDRGDEWTPGEGTVTNKPLGPEDEPALDLGVIFDYVPSPPPPPPILQPLTATAHPFRPSA